MKPKAEMWHQIQQTAPDMATVLVAIRRVFGRPEAVRVVVDDVVLVDTGEPT